MLNRRMWCEEYDRYVIGITCAMCDKYKCKKRSKLIDDDIIEYLLDKGYKKSYVLVDVTKEKKARGKEEFILIESDVTDENKAKRVKVTNKFELHLRFSLTGREMLSHWKGCKPQPYTRALVLGNGKKEDFKVVAWKLLTRVIKDSKNFPLEIWAVREVRYVRKKGGRGEKKSRKTDVRTGKHKRKAKRNKRDNKRSKGRCKSDNKCGRNNKECSKDGIEGTGGGNKKHSK